MIRKFLDKVKSDELLRGSLVLLIMINLFNLFNFIFHFVLARMLTPAMYGILAVLMSFVGIYAIPAEAIQTVISKHATKFSIKKEYGKIKDVLIVSLKKGLVIASVGFVLFNAVYYFVFAKPLGIDFMLLFISSFMIFSFFLFPVVRGILQGQKRFYALGYNMVLESVLKLVLAVALVWLGFEVYGAISGVVLAFIIFFILSFLFIKKILYTKRERSGVDKIFRSNIPILVIISGIVLFYSLDVILAKMVFSPDLAGKYAVLSLIGKMIFFGTYAISKAMFPISVQREEEKSSSQDLIKKSGLLVLGAVILALIVLGAFPKLIIGILFGSQYVELAGYLIYVAIAFGILSLTNLFLLYGLAKNKISTLESLSIVLFVVAEATLLLTLGTTLLRFITIFIIINVLMFLWSLMVVRR